MRVLRKKINLTILSRSLIDKTSICRYRKKPALDEGGNPLDWWRPRRPQFPRLKRPARKYFCILATSTQAERVFSCMDCVNSVSSVSRLQHGATSISDGIFMFM